MTRRECSGFTLLELLVVLGIVAILIALLVPAIQKVRESASRLQCASHLRQIGLAAHQYHDSHNRLPPGYLGPSMRNETNFATLYQEGQWVGHFPLLLPFLEQEPLFRSIDVDFAPSQVSPRKWFWSEPAFGPGIPHVGNYTAARHSLPLFRCPSAPPYTPEFNNPNPGRGGTMLGVHVFNDSEHGPFTVSWRDEYGNAAAYRPLGRTNYVGVAGCGTGKQTPFDQYEGVYTNRRANTLGTAGVPDGTSTTLLYGELCGSRWTSGPRTCDLAWMAAGGMGTYLGLQKGDDALLISFSSYHPGGVSFCFADGSVRMLRFGTTKWSGQLTAPRSTDWLVLQQLAGRSDGAAVEATALES